MALQLGLRGGFTAIRSSRGAFGTSPWDVAKRFKSTDAGDVIGIDLGTTNSCVAIMVRFALFAP
jgi:molecular chaperone DnaK